MIFNKLKKLKQQKQNIGITFGAFDLFHAGHIAMLSEAISSSSLRQRVWQAENIKEQS